MKITQSIDDDELQNSYLLLALHYANTIFVQKLDYYEKRHNL